MTRTAGFSLVEMLVALAVTSMLAIAGSMLLVQTLRSGNMVENRTDMVKGLNIAHSQLRDDLANATLRKTRSPDGLDGAQAFRGGLGGIGTRDPLLVFTRSGWANPGSADTRGDLQRVEYFLQEDRLVRRAWLRPDPVRNTPYADRTVTEGLSGVGLRFFVGGAWRLDWVGQDKNLPELVELTFVYSQNDELRQMFLVGGSG